MKRWVGRAIPHFVQNDKAGGVWLRLGRGVGRMILRYAQNDKATGEALVRQRGREARGFGEG